MSLADRMIDLGVRDLTVIDLSRGALEATPAAEQTTTEEVPHARAA